MSTNCRPVWHAIAVACLLTTASAGLQAADKPAEKQPEKQAKLVCVNAPATGSHIRRRNCMTEEQMAERRKRDQEAMARVKGPVTPLPQGR